MFNLNATLISFCQKTIQEKKDKDASPKAKTPTNLPLKTASNKSMGSPKKMKLTPEQARLEIQAAVRFANDRTNNFTDFVRSFRGDTFGNLLQGLKDGEKNIHDALKKLRDAGGEKDGQYELLIDNTLRDMRNAAENAKNLEKSFLASEDFKKCEQSCMHARDELYQLIRKAKPTQELSPRAKGSSPLHAAMAAQEGKGVRFHTPPQ